MLIPTEFSTLALQGFSRLALLEKRTEERLGMVQGNLHTYLDTPAICTKRDGSTTDSHTALMLATAVGVKTRFHNAVRQMAVVNLLMAAPGRYESLLLQDDNSVVIKPLNTEDPDDDPVNLSYSLLKSVADDCSHTLALSGIVESSRFIDNSTLRMIQVGCESVIARVGALDRILHSSAAHTPHSAYQAIRIPTPHEDYSTVEGIESTLYEAAISQHDASECRLEIASAVLDCIAQRVPLTRHYLIGDPDVPKILNAVGYRLT